MILSWQTSYTQDRSYFNQVERLKGSDWGAHDVLAGGITNAVSLFQGPVAWSTYGGNVVSALGSDNADGENGNQPSEGGGGQHLDKGSEQAES